MSLGPPMMRRGHPYIPNSAPEIQAEMLRAIGVESIEALYASVPPELRLRGPLDLPPPLTDEVALRRHVSGLLERNTMRSYLAIDAYLDTASLPAGEQVERRIRAWSASTARYARQLHEMDANDYLEMKRKEIRLGRQPG